MLTRRVIKISEQLSNLDFWYDLTPERRSVLINMAYNLGVNGLINFKKMIAALKIGDYEKASVEMKDSKWYRQVGNRAVRLRQEMRG